MKTINTKNIVTKLQQMFELSLMEKQSVEKYFNKNNPLINKAEVTSRLIMLMEEVNLNNKGNEQW